MATFFGVCFVLLVRAVGARSPWLGLLAMFYFMGLGRVAEPLFRLRVPRILRASETGPVVRRVDRWPGVRGFGMLLRRTPLRHLNGSVYLAGRDVAALRVQIDSAEAIHFWAAVLFTPYIAYVAARGQVVEAALFVLVQGVVNVYPILHLRVVRGRLARVEGLAGRSR